MSGGRGQIYGGKRGRLRRRDVLAAIAAVGGAATWPQLARAQQRRMATVGYLYAGSIGGLRGSGKPFFKGLAELGYIEARNVAVEFREARNDLTLLPKLARELVHRRVDVIVVPGSMRAVLAARAATTTIPIVFSNAGDPIKAGLITNLSHPGGNITGVNDVGVDLSAKRLELIRELVPGASKVALLIAPDNLAAGRELANAREGARLLGIETVVLAAGTAPEIDAALATLADKPFDALCVSPSAPFYDHRARIVALAAQFRMPTAYPFIQFAQIGGLMSYGSSLWERAHQTGIYVGRILNGTKPAELPVYRLTQFELAINMTTAKSLGIAVPSRLLALADKVIE